MAVGAFVIVPGGAGAPAAGAFAGSCFALDWSPMSDRKYGQKGYQDSDRGEKRSCGPQALREKKEGLCGRGLGAPTATVFRCVNCGTKIPTTGEVAFTDACPKCKTDLHTCANCSHFDTAARYECRQPIPERIAKKRDRNDCTLFAVKATVEFAADERRPPDDARAAFDALFKL